MGDSNNQKTRASSPIEARAPPVDAQGKARFPNPPEKEIPDAATLREQWKYAKRQYSRWYSHAWGTAILAGASFYALGWFIKGSNPLPSLSSPSHPHDRSKP